LRLVKTSGSITAISESAIDLRSSYKLWRTQIAINVELYDVQYLQSSDSSEMLCAAANCTLDSLLM